MFSFSQNLGETVVKYGCLPGGGCNYLSEGSDYPHPSFCTFKEVVREWNCLESGSIFKVDQWRGDEVIWTGDLKVWPATDGISAHGHKESVSGAFQDGDMIKPWVLPNEPTKSPSKMPTDTLTKVSVKFNAINSATACIFLFSINYGPCCTMLSRNQQGIPRMLRSRVQRKFQLKCLRM